MGEGAPYAWSFMLGVWWHVGDGQSIFCKEEAWELGLFLHPPRTIPNHQRQITRVCQHLSSNSAWDMSKLTANFEANDI